MLERPAGEPFEATHLKAMTPTTLSLRIGEEKGVADWKVSDMATSGSLDSDPAERPVVVVLSTMTEFGRKLTLMFWETVWTPATEPDQPVLMMTGLPEMEPLKMAWEAEEREEPTWAMDGVPEAVRRFLMAL